MASGGSCEEQVAHFDEMCKQSGQYQEMCDKTKYRDKCMEQAKKHINFEGMITGAEEMCGKMAKRALLDMEMGCKRMDLDYRRCKADTEMRCNKVQEAVDKCHAISSPEAIRDVIVKKAKYECRMMGLSVRARQVDLSELEMDDIIPVTVAVDSAVTEVQIEQLKEYMADITSEDKGKDITLLRGFTTMADFKNIESLTNFVYGVEVDTLSLVGESAEGNNVMKAISTLEASKAMVSDDYQMWIEHEQGNILDAEDKAMELEDADAGKGIGYRFQKFLGIMKEREEAEAQELDAQAAKIDESIISIEELIEQVEDVSVKAALQDQLSLLEDRKEELGAMAEAKQKGAAGFFGMLGGG